MSNRNSGHGFRNVLLDILIVLAAALVVVLFLQMRRQDAAVQRKNAELAASIPKATVEVQAPRPTRTPKRTRAATQAPESTPAPETEAPADETDLAADVTEILAAVTDALSGAEDTPAPADADPGAEETAVQPADADPEAEEIAAETAVVAVEAVVLTPTPAPTERPAVSLRLAVLGDELSAFGGEELYPAGDVNNETDLWWYTVFSHLPVTLESEAVSAVRGSAFSMGDADAGAPWQPERITALGAEGAPDLILVMLGLNDPLWADTGAFVRTGDRDAIAAMAPSTARGAALTLLALQEAWPDAAVTVILPPLADLSAAGEEALTEQRFNFACNTIQEVAWYFDIPVIDLRDCGITADNAAETTLDGWHPNLEGMRRMAEWIAGELEY